MAQLKIRTEPSELDFLHSVLWCIDSIQARFRFAKRVLSKCMFQAASTTLRRTYRIALV